MADMCWYYIRLDSVVSVDDYEGHGPVAQPRNVGDAREQVLAWGPVRGPTIRVHLLLCGWRFNRAGQGWLAAFRRAGCGHFLVTSLRVVGTGRRLRCGAVRLHFACETQIYVFRLPST